ncbi:MAG: hypothetical protein EP329_06500 [Deltaproteobacteria bacterium]|nr:MAG: hypothetical protein EP329_06500 [Deltaproteobacteria bacterium]
MDSVRRRRYGSCRDCGWIYELAVEPTACPTCGGTLAKTDKPRAFQRTPWAEDGQAHVAAHVKASTASVRAPWAERLDAELEKRPRRLRPDTHLHAALQPIDGRVVPGGHDTSMDALADFGGLGMSRGQVATATLLGGLTLALLAWVIL